MFESDANPVAEIERLELRIEELSESIQRSRRLDTVGRVAAVGGLAALAGMGLGLLNFVLVRLLVALSLALGGVILMGSSKTSTDELERKLKRAEAERNAAIDALVFVPLGAGEPASPRGGA